MIPKQQTFDTVVAHLRRQNAQSMLGESCAYRGDGGLKCAVGCLIPDDRYTTDIEYGIPAWDPQDVPKAPSLAVAALLRDLGHDLELCRQLQMVHDNDIVYPNGEYEIRLEEIAEMHGLLYSAPEKSHA